MAMCFALGVIFGVLVNLIAPLLSSNAVHFMILSQNGMSITAHVSFMKCDVGIVSLNAVDKAMHSTSAVDEEISVCVFYFQMMGHPECFIENPILERADSRSSSFAALKPP